MVECTSLENWSARKGTKGSNPFLSARKNKARREVCYYFLRGRDSKAGARRREAGSRKFSAENYL